MPIIKKIFWEKKEKKEGPTEIWTRIAGFKVQSANHYTMGPLVRRRRAVMRFESAVKIETLPRNWVENNYTNDVKKVLATKLKLNYQIFKVGIQLDILHLLWELVNGKTVIIFSVDGKRSSSFSTFSQAAIEKENIQVPWIGIP